MTEKKPHFLLQITEEKFWTKSSDLWCAIIAKQTNVFISHKILHKNIQTYEAELMKNEILMHLTGGAVKSLFAQIFSFLRPDLDII
ncbi:hypothetical protein T05_2581 [Trichinella murrelli]|uniref:Uncharacterized protein n=1 Tax=Trichinella murrelli TaxID=144512 RepID=A0A0V0TR26_9BILA|nr:hypothetical protein T05_2581 [Trichinella murrelli]